MTFHRRSGRWLPGLAAAVLACGPARVPPPTVTFAETADTLLVRYSAVPAAAWLGGQRWVIVSPEYEEVVRVDFAARTIRIVGDSTRYRNPASVFTVGDTIYLPDWGLRQTTVWGPDDRLLATIPVGDRTRGSYPRARDAAGQFYFEVTPNPGRLGEGNRDSAAVVRATPDLSTVDTVVRLTPLDIAEVAGQGGRRFERRVFSGNDQWGVLPDGTVWVARVYQNRVLWISPRGETRRGPLLPDPVYEVTAADREYFVQQFPEELRATADELPFALVKPPFERSATGTDGLIWLQKSRPLLDSVRRYQVIDREGRLDHVVILPGNGQVVALGDGVALVVEQYREGLRLLQFAIPSPPPAPQTP